MSLTKYVDVLLDIPVIEPPPIYTYSLDVVQKSISLLGRRVIAELGRKKLEGWIINELEQPPRGVLPKAITKIYEEEPVFNDTLLELARWISENTVCPLNTAVKAMLPPRSRSKAKTIVLGHSDPALENGLEQDAAELIRRLRDLGFMEWDQALHLVGRGQLEILKSRGIIKTLGAVPVKERGGKWQYVANCHDRENFEILLRKAPRQAQAMQLIAEYKSLEASELDKKFGKTVIQSLLQKGLILKEQLETELVPPDFKLNLDQETVLAELEKAVKSALFQEALLFGVTGSGKTEIYLQIAQRVIKQGRQVIVLVPEIALTRHLTGIFSSRIPRMAVLHSRMAAGHRTALWSSMSRGEIDLVLGTRMAVFAPLPDVGLIILDEEQENSYKQEETPRYHARETARKRTQIENALLLLGSATPSLESYERAVSGKIKLLELKERVRDADLPEVEVVDMRRVQKSTIRRQALAPLLLEKIEQELKEGQQSILFINRRGHSPLTMCRVCGKALQCPNCSVAMAYHRHNNKNLCHYCGYSEPPRQTCPACGNQALDQMGIGTQRVEEEVKKHFPGARVRRLDIDSSSSGLQEEILSQMKNGEIDILIGTQMVAKGLDYPAVSLVGIVDADGLLNLPDFRSGERGFQLMVQAAGRAGRGFVKGRVIIQSYNPEHYVIEKAARHDYEGFFIEENAFRKLLSYPPYTHILRVVSSSEQEDTASLFARALFRLIEEALDAQEDMPQILGPAPCPLLRIHKRFRYQILVKSPNILLLSSIGKYIISRERPADSRIEIDIDPLVTM